MTRSSEPIEVDPRNVRIKNQRDEIKSLERQLREARESRPEDVDRLHKALERTQSALARSIHRGQQAEADRDRYGEALEQIRDRDWVENCLDPQWAPQRAKEALAR